MSAENPADTVIKQAARAITACIGPDRKWADCTPLLFARALSDAVLLADPADRDELQRLRAQVDGWHPGSAVGAARMIRAEAEVAELRATIDRVRELADKYRKFSGFNITARGAEKQLRAALDGAGERQ